MTVFIVIVAISFGLEPALLGEPLVVSETTRRIFFAMNMGTSLLIVFIAASWSTANLEKALVDVKEAHLHLVDTEKQAVVGRLVAGILHEMNTPLGSIRSSTQTMAKVIDRCSDFVTAHADGESRVGKRALRTVQALPGLRRDVDTGIDRLGDVVSSLSRFVSLDESDQKDLDVTDSLDTAITLLGDTFGERIEVACDDEDGLPPVHCFPAKLNQVFLSVLQNAAESIERDGRIDVGIAAHGGDVVVDIRDNGRGIPPAQLKGIFEIGFTRQAGRIGMQLGLPMSKRHLAEIGGDIAIDSTEGKGTLVRITLPTEASN